MEVKQLMAIASTTLFITALIVNITFIYIVYNNGKKSIGTYKYLLASFSLCNILYSSFGYASKPGVHIYGTSCMIYNNGLYEDSPKWGTLLLCFFHAMYGMGTALLALHFLYRYFIVCRPEQSRYFELPCLALWIIPMLLWGLLYAFLAYYSFGPTEEFYDYAEDSVRNILHRELRMMPFFCMFTHKVEGGLVTVYWKASVGLAISTIMLILTFGLMVICGIKIMKTLREIVMSKKAVALQKQLLAALTVQALIPFMLSYLPRLSMYFFVVMGFPPLEIYMFVPSIITISTVLDPLAIVFFVNEYRIAIIELFKKPLLLLFKNNTTESVNYSIKTNITSSLHS